MAAPTAPRSSPVPASPPPAARRYGQTDSWGGSSGGGGWGGSWGGGSRGGGWSGGWRPPGYAYNTPPRFGIWDGLFLWFLLDNLSRAGSADFFHNHRDDPGYAQWRAEAERRAQDDAELRRKLDDLDRQLAERKDQPRDPNYLPPDIPRDAAVAEDRAGGRGGMGFGLVLAVLLIGGGVAMVLWMRSRRRSQTPAGPAPASSPASMAGRILRNAVGGGEPYKPSLFRVGMTLTADPTPFILAGGVTKVAAPDTGSGGLVSVEAVGTLTAGGTTLHRLYLPGGGFFQLHLGADGKPDECRYFSPLDEVSPASAEEWGFWLDPAEGMIGWPEFQTKDGKLYARQWAPGQSRVQPYGFAEQRQEAGGEQSRRLQSMLYAAPTGAASPAPPTEYILVTAVEQAGQAWVEVHAGIDVNPAILSLA
ncbi:DUF2491 domain-containing protein (plasmid) [Azospirillum thermophilum]|uniref:DUF2491 domain-containing protein n=2 Tax=Azospirillum thermophilum TaxID=2202148 RepID=A0A2S2CXV9_9PROT|nr:DUF2491 domain-containing protein [Azospirillum thermophilum]